MNKPPPSIDLNYEKFYATRSSPRVYPTEFVVRTFLANYPGLEFCKPAVGQRVLDIAFGDNAIVLTVINHLVGLEKKRLVFVRAELLLQQTLAGLSRESRANAGDQNRACNPQNAGRCI